MLREKVEETLKNARDALSDVAKYAEAKNLGAPVLKSIEEAQADVTRLINNEDRDLKECMQVLLKLKALTESVFRLGFEAIMDQALRRTW